MVFNAADQVLHRRFFAEVPDTSAVTLPAYAGEKTCRLGTNQTQTQPLHRCLLLRFHGLNGRS